MLLTCPLLLILSAAPARVAPPQPSTILRFESDEFWLNLHHYLYVLGRAQAKMADAAREAVAGAPADESRGLERLSEAERTAWREAVTFYAAGPSRQDLIFDEPLRSITRALAEAGRSASLTGTSIDAALAAALERAAPIYRKAWWPDHQSANHARQSELQALVDRYGRRVLQTITSAYGMTWPADGYPVHLSAFSNWAGAYSTTGNLLVVSGLARDLRGSQGLEIVFHEGMHQWDDEIVGLLRDHAQRIGKLVPRNLSHAMIFFTAGEAVRRAIPDHVPYADAAGVWDRGMAFKAPLQETWKPYLDGRGTRDEALAALVVCTATEPRR